MKTARVKELLQQFIVKKISNESGEEYQKILTNASQAEIIEIYHRLYLEEEKNMFKYANAILLTSDFASWIITLNYGGEEDNEKDKVETKKY